MASWLAEMALIYINTVVNLEGVPWVPENPSFGFSFDKKLGTDLQQNPRL